ncbi:MAG: hypothetical protein GY796_20345 [Chloroflexi bacterium]|nr:hypothetical protein [Chloroflexota bacterium]
MWSFSQSGGGLGRTILEKTSELERTAVHPITPLLITSLLWQGHGRYVLTLLYNYLK